MRSITVVLHHFIVQRYGSPRTLGDSIGTLRPLFNCCWLHSVYASSGLVRSVHGGRSGIYRA